MCGFLGAITSAGGGGAGVDLARGGRFVARRGPDSMKHWTSPDGRIEILHARLAIVDEGGIAHQPLTDLQTGTTVAFNGEIYNYPELRAELSSFPYRTSSDTEVILAAYRRWGISGLSRFRGMFSLVLADGASGTVYLARDHVGKKPLFLAEWEGHFIFGSSVLAIAAASRRFPALHPTAPTDYWADGHVSPTQSVFTGCCPVLPGQIVEIRRDGGVRSFAIDEPLDEPRIGDTNRTQLADLLRTAVLRRLRDNPHPVSLLSGGIDSTVVTAVLERETSLQALTLGSLVPWTQDERYARYASRRLQLPLKVISPSVGRIEDDVDFCLELQDEPLGMMSFLPLALLLRAVKPYGRILFTGDGGDEVFLGYGRPSDWTESTAPPAPGALRSGPRVPEWMSAWGRKTVTHALVGHMFAKLDRASAEQGIEVRCPLLDWDVMAFARSLPPSALLASDRPKHLLKDQLDGWPAWFLNRPKIGFAYNLRWAWAIRRFAGLRDRIDSEALATFESSLPRTLAQPPARWATREIWRHFPYAWRLLAWSAFLRRTRATMQTLDVHKATA
jgi:asparagine synthase (glutamine-hydrolysing)